MSDYKSNSYRSISLRSWFVLAAVAFTSCGQHDGSDASETMDQVAGGGDSDAAGDIEPEANSANMAPMKAEGSTSGTERTDSPSTAAPTGSEAPSVSPEKPALVEPETPPTIQPQMPPSTTVSANPTSADPPRAPAPEAEPTPSAASQPSTTGTTTTGADSAPTPTNPPASSPPTDLPLAVCSTDIGAVANGSNFSINSETQHYDRHVLEMRLGDMLRRTETYVTTGDAGHQHYVKIQDAKLVTLLEGGSVTVTSDPPMDSESTHTHTIVVAACPSNLQR